MLLTDEYVGKNGMIFCMSLKSDKCLKNEDCTVLAELDTFNV